MKFIALAMVLATLVGCQNANQNTLTGVEYGCASATAAMKTAIVFNDKLTPAQRRQIVHATDVINPICSQPNVPTLDSTARAGFDAALKELTGVASAVAQ